MKIGSLFSGYGGLDMAVQSVLGGHVAWHFEYDEAPSKILAHHWPWIPNYGDVTTIEWADVTPIEILTAGYPCQPFSTAGSRKGSKDERHLWPYVLDAIRYLRPRVVVLENVRGHLTLGFDTVLKELAEAGYDTDWICIPASDAGAPHKRERIFIVAHPQDDGHEWNGDAADDRGAATSDSAGARRARREDPSPSGSDASAIGSGGVEPERARGERTDWGDYAAAIERWEGVIGRRAPAPAVHGRLAPNFVEWMMGLPAGHVSSVDISRSKQLKALGNGVVPQQAALALSILLGPTSHSVCAD